jgi:hypothetical protein
MSAVISMVEYPRIFAPVSGSGLLVDDARSRVSERMKA